MTVTLTIGGTSVALPGREGVKVDDQIIGASARMYDGSLQVDVRANKHKVTIAWEGLTPAEKATLRTAWLSCLTVARVLALPDGQSFTVLANINAWAESHFYDAQDVCWYNVSATFEEV